MIPITDEQAKALQEVAKTTKTGLELTGKLGTFLARMGGDAFAQMGDMATDQIKLWRYQQFLRIADKVNEIHRQRGIEGKPVPIPLKLALPILEAASLEEDETLQGLWAKLIANAMDPEYSEHIHPAYIEVIKQLSADEALILSAFAKRKDYPPNAPTVNIFGATVRRVNEYAFSTYWDLCKSLPLKQPDSDTEYLDNLQRLRIVETNLSELNGRITNDDYTRGPSVEINKEETFSITYFGRAFIKACISESTPEAN